MKWSFVIQQKLKAAVLLSAIMLFIMLNSFIAQSSMDAIDQSFSSIYEDRLVPAIDIVYLSEHLYTKRLLLERSLSNKKVEDSPHIANQLDKHNRKIDSLIIEFEKTSLIEEEVKCLDAFKGNIRAYATLEKTIIQLRANSADDARDLFYTQGSLIFEKSVKQLGDLTKIQSVVGKKLLKDSHTEAYYFSLLSTLQIVSAIVVGVLILGLIYSSKIINKDSTTPFHLN